jgi:Ca-activated chloride channel family protein
MHLRSSRACAGGLGLALLLVLANRDAWCQVDLSAWPQVRMEVLALDQNGMPVPGVAADALVARGLRKPVAVTNLEPTEEPQSVCVLVDASDSLGDGLSMVQTKARRLLKKLSVDDEVCVAAFSSKLWIAQPLTKDRAAVLQALTQVRPTGGTQLRDGLVDLAQYMRGAGRFRSRAIILISDGSDRHSLATNEQLKRELEAEGSPVVHMICLPEAFGRARNKQYELREGTAFKLHELSGGLTYFPHTMADIDAIVDTLPDTMRTRYIVTYAAESAARDGHEERIEISFDKAHQNMKARIQGPEGYYAPSK